MPKRIFNLQVPEVMEYIKKRAELYELKKNLKIWSRRRHIQEVLIGYLYLIWFLFTSLVPKKQKNIYDIPISEVDLPKL